MTASRDLARAARRLADQTSSRISGATGTRQIIATVETVTAGAASDGNARVTLLWRGGAITAAGYAAAYTPVAGHRVVCDYIDDQLIVAYRIVGQP